MANRKTIEIAAAKARAKIHELNQLMLVAKGISAYYLNRHTEAWQRVSQAAEEAASLARRAFEESAQG